LVQILQQNYIILQEEREDITKIIRDVQTIDSVEETGDIKVTMNYYNYIILVFIVFLLIFLFIRFSTNSEQIGGGHHYPNIFKLLLILTVLFVIFYYHIN
jgi:glucan phosphoethanolaminetransferase (alkaline phosphatase superfamily)